MLQSLQQTAGAGLRQRVAGRRPSGPSGPLLHGAERRLSFGYGIRRSGDWSGAANTVSPLLQILHLSERQKNNHNFFQRALKPLLEPIRGHKPARNHLQVLRALCRPPHGAQTHFFRPKTKVLVRSERRCGARLLAVRS